jgi:hypothetical protein
VFALRGFTLHNHEYIRVTGEVSQTIVVPLLDYAPIFDFTLTFGFRVEAAEAIFAQFWHVDPEYRAKTRTISVNLVELVPNAGEWIRVSDRLSLVHALAELLPALESDALPFLDAHQDLHTIDSLMNGVNHELFAFSGGPFYAMSSIIVAHLARNPDRDRLVEAHRQQSWYGGDTQAAEAYDRLVEYLAHLS